MKVLAAVMHKGGVGKTLLSKIFSEYFTLKGFSTLGIDLDNQCNYSRRFLEMEINHDTEEGVLPPIHPAYDPNDKDDADWDGRSSIADLFFDEPVLPYSTKTKNLDICPSHPTRLLDAERVRKNEEHLVHVKLKDFLSIEDIQKKYEIVIIDTAPSRGPLTIAALKAATHIVIPAVMEPQSIEGLYGMLQLYKTENLNRDPNNQLKLIGIQPNMFKATRQHKEILDNLKNSGKISQYLMPSTLGHRTIFSEVDQDGCVPHSVFAAKKLDKARLEATEMCEHVQKRLFENE